MTRRNALATSAFLFTTLAMLLLSAPAQAIITTTGSVWHTPAANGVVDGEMKINNGSVTVTDGDTLTTTDRSFLGYSAGTTATVTVTDSTWNAESAVFVASSAVTNGTVELNNSTWTVESNMTIAQGQDSVAQITLNGGSLWDVDFAIKIGYGKGGDGTITINDGTWSAMQVTLGGAGFTTSYGTGTININAAGTMTNRYGLDVTDYGTVQLDGGLLSLVGENDFDGTVAATTNGGTIRLDAGLNSGIFGLINVGEDVDFTNCDIEIYFNSAFTPNASNTFNLFDPTDGIDLGGALTDAATISTPTGWALDNDTGIMTSVVPEPSTLLTIALSLLSFAPFYRRRK